MLTIQKVEITDTDTLLAFSRETFYEFFAKWNNIVNMDAYAAIAFNPQKIHAELSNPNSEFYFAMLNAEVAGYLKLNFNGAQTELKDKNALEIERIYVSGKYHGKHIGKQLLDFATDIALNKRFSYVWLGVWEHNDKAIGFYEHYGFQAFSSHEFMLGDDKQTDLLMKKLL
jgi:ribosomal protein S18 acetylase RimI-like enzyme